jgi:hypothetical protein
VPAAARIAPLLLAAALAGCGNSRTPVPDVTRSADPTGWTSAQYPAAGVRVRLPRNWPLAPGTAPAVASATSGRATVALWRYPRTEPLPRTGAQLAAARRAVVSAARARDATLRVAAVRPTTVAGVPGVVITGAETIRGVRVRLRSTHLYAQGAEVVADAFAPPGEFSRLDRLVFRRVERSLRLGAPTG